jgi:glycerol uptake facilitator protein
MLPEGLQVPPQTRLLQQCVAECMGTALMVLLGCGSVSAAVLTDAVHGVFQVAAVWGCAVVLAIFLFGRISGAHFNPAISLAMAAFRPSSFSRNQLFPYLFSQFIGALVGAALSLFMYLPSLSSFEVANPQIAREAGEDSVATARILGEYFSPLSSLAAFFIEAIATSILSFVIFGLTDKNNSAVSQHCVPALIGMCIVALICVFGPLTQAGMNPARDFSPRIIALCAGWPVDVCFQGWWVYIFGPIFGALTGAWLYNSTSKPALKKAQECGCEGSKNCN